MSLNALWPIRIRRTLDENGESQSRSVFCRARGDSINLVECRSCVYSSELIRNPRGEAVYVECSRQSSPSDVAPEKVRRAATAAEATPLSSVMTPSVWCAGPGLLVSEARRMFDQRLAGSLPVVDREGYLMGILSRANLPPSDTGVTVAEVMSPVAFSLDERAPIAHAAALMAVEGVHHLPVVAAGGEVVGILSTLDVAAWVARQSGYSV